MQISFDPSIKVAGISIVPWNRIGLEKWFPEYKIASLYSWDIDPHAKNPELLSLSDRGNMPAMNRLNTSELLKADVFQRLLEEELPGYALLTYKTVPIPVALQQRKFLMANESISSQYENKAEFRRMFAGKIPIPEFAIYERAELTLNEAGYHSVLCGRNAVVMQDEQLSGGRGTFIVKSHEDYVAAVKTLNKRSTHHRVVISTLIEGARERSIQCCVTRYGVFTGPLQRQIVRHPLLAHAQADGDQYCGVQICAADQMTPIHTEAQRIAQRIGEEYQAAGYKGIFGVDYLLDAHDTLYAIEVNPRITGVTPLLTSLYSAETSIPFYLLHVLELGDYTYEIPDKSFEFSEEGAMLVVHSLESQPVIVESLPKSGTYRLENGALSRVTDSVALEDTKPGEWVVREYSVKGMVVKPGGRLLAVQTRELIVDKSNDKLYDETVTFIQTLRKHIETRKIGLWQ